MTDYPLLNGAPLIDIVASAKRNALPAHEREAEDTCDELAKGVAGMLLEAIASLPFLVGRGTAPNPKACNALATRITGEFSAYVLAAIEGDDATKALALVKSGAPPVDVCRLVVAARIAVEEPTSDAITALNEAAEAFASRVCRDDDGGDIPEAHADPCTCGKKEDAA